MGRFGQVVQLLAVAIVLIAAALLPSRAEAHGGHHGGPHVHSPAVQASAVASPAPEGRRYAFLSPSAPELPSAERPCTGPCCAASPPCCSPALAPEGVSLRLPASGGRIAADPDWPMRPGFDPEALPEPPRTFA